SNAGTPVASGSSRTPLVTGSSGMPVVSGFSRTSRRPIMFGRKEQVLVFGAGVGARRAVACLRHRCRVLAFLGNDPAKRDGRLLGRPILGPDGLGRYAFDKIYVASMYADQIYRQLTVDLRVDPARIAIVRRDILEGAYEVSPWSYAALAGLSL